MEKLLENYPQIKLIHMTHLLENLKKKDPEVLESNRKKQVKNKNPKENMSQLYAMFEKGMWDMFEIILTNSKKGEIYDFTILDPPHINDIKKHPLMLLARSGQEALLTHKTMETLLNLKWRTIPRMAFYGNVILYVVFIVLYSFYSLEMANETNKEPLSINYNLSTRNDTLNGTFPRDDAYESNLLIPLLVFLSFNIFKMCLQIALMEGLSFLISLEGWFEKSSYILALISIVYKDLELKSVCSSVAVILAFLNLALLIQKLGMFGLYVMAFKRTVKNSLTFLPIFGIIFIGFLISFKVRAANDMTYFNSSTSAVLIDGFTMMLGDFQTDQMGVESSMVNYILYFAFLAIMSIITLNLFVGIAVGELNTVLSEADIQQISMRVVFVLKVTF